MSKNIFITGIGTDVGKTIVSAIVTEALQADYWKPIQSGSIEVTDSETIKKLISNSKTIFHPESYLLKEPQSPHFAAELENKTIEFVKINRPKTENTLIIEGAGGLLVPLNDENTIADLIFSDDFVLVVSKHYLGSINHTLLTINELKKRSCHKIGIIFVGESKPSTEIVIEKTCNVPIIARVEILNEITKESIKIQSELLKNKLLQFIST